MRGIRHIIGRAGSLRALRLAVFIIAATLAFAAVGLPPIAGGTPVAAAASCTKFFDHTIQGIAADFVYGPQTRLWLTEGGLATRLVRGISPGGGADVTYSLGDPDTYGTGDPQGIAAAIGDDGRLWIAGGTSKTIIALDLSTGAASPNHRRALG